MPFTNSNGRNHLYRIRRIRGLRQKQLARLLGYRSTAPISRFEAGIALPPLKVALLMEIVLGVRLQDVYIDLFHSLEQQALRRANTLPHALSRQIRGRLLGDDSS